MASTINFHHLVSWLNSADFTGSEATTSDVNTGSLSKGTSLRSSGG